MQAGSYHSTAATWACGGLLSFRSKRKLTMFMVLGVTASVVAFAYGFEQRLTEFDGYAVAVQHVDGEAGIKVDKTLLFPVRNRPAIARTFLERPRRHAFTVGANIASVGRLDSHLEAFDASDLHLERSDFHRPSFKKEISG